MGEQLNFFQMKIIENMVYVIYQMEQYVRSGLIINENVIV